MTGSGWKYLKDEWLERSVPVKQAIGIPGGHEAFSALLRLKETSLGQRLLAKAVEKEVRLGIAADIPVYGLVIPPDQSGSGAPHIVVSGDTADWANDFGLFLWSHELAHICQMEHGLLRNFPSYGVSYDSTAPKLSVCNRSAAQTQMAETILTERMADIIGMGAAVQYSEIRPDSPIKALLQGTKETAGLFNAMRPGVDAGDWNDTARSAWLRALMAPEGFTPDEWRYYSAYGKGAALSVSKAFNAASMADSVDYLQAQCELASRLFEVQDPNLKL